MSGEAQGSEGSDFRGLVREAVRGEGFVKLTVQGAVQGETVPWARVTIRPVLVRGRRRLQFSYRDGKKDLTRNLFGPEADEKLEEVLALSFRQFHVQSTTGDVHIRITKKGKALVQREKPRAAEAAKPALSHDRVKEQPLPLSRPDAFLQALGVMDGAGRIRPGMQAKYRQINEFLRLLASAVGGPPGPTGEPLEIVDCGSGNAYLTFAAYHYLTHVLEIPTRVTGVDANPEVVERSRQRAESLGWSDLRFHVSRIGEFVPARPPQLVLSLHACDTATDEAIALGVKLGSEAILAAPCCQHELFDQLAAPLFQPVLRHGVLRQRMADLLTDAFRALALRIVGYRTDVVQFVSPEHTTKNLMIRARKLDPPAFPPELAREYVALRDYWSVRPAIEQLLGEEFAARLRG